MAEFYLNDLSVIQFDLITKTIEISNGLRSSISFENQYLQLELYENLNGYNYKFVVNQITAEPHAKTIHVFKLGISNYLKNLAKEFRKGKKERNLKGIIGEFGMGIKDNIPSGINGEQPFAALIIGTDDQRVSRSTQGGRGVFNLIEQSEGPVIISEDQDSVKIYSL